VPASRPSWASPTGTELATNRDIVTTLPPASPIRAHFLADHGELEELFTRLLAAFEANVCIEVARLWSEFDERLSKHLEAEEHLMIPQLSSSRPRDARALLEEHRHVRSRLVELGLGVDLHLVRLGAARGFVEELRAHARHEDDVIYQWADDHFADHERGELFAALTAPLRARAPVA
jgi:hemerythrin-like domain-containing protein